MDASRCSSWCLSAPSINPHKEFCSLPSSTTASASKQHPQQLPSSSKPPKPLSSAAADPQIPNPNPIPSPYPITVATMTKSQIMMCQEDKMLSCASHLTCAELLRRRSHHLKQLSNIYRDHYWALMEDLKAQYREYYWRFGVSPFKEDQNQTNQRSRLGLEGDTADGDAVEGRGENGNNFGKSDSDLISNNRCSFVGCKLKAMALTSFCHLHIVSDNKQRLYKACTYVIKSARAGPITCGKPILRSTVPSLCNVHFQNAQKHVTRALKKAGLNVSSSSKLAPKFHVIVAEFVCQIQAQRRAAIKDDKLKTIVKEENAS